MNGIVDATTPTGLAAALSSGLLWVSIGAALVVVAWVVAKVQHGVPFAEQLAHFWESAKAPLVAGLGAAGVTLMAGDDWKAALAAGLTIALVGANVRKPRAEADE